MDKINLYLPHQKRKKKGASKPLINSFLIAIGDGIKIDYTIEEENRSYNYQLTLNSGDAFVVSSEVQALNFGISRIIERTQPKELLLREGSLLITVERD